MSAIRLGDGWIDLDAGLVRRGEDSVGLTTIEQRLLTFLASRSGEVVGRDELLQEVWQYRAGVRSRTIDNTVRRIREKIEPDPSEPVHLHVVYGRGLRLDAPLGAAAPTEIPAAPSFFGREAEGAEIRAALARGVRQVAVWGPAGAGKSRLVSELGRGAGWIEVPLDGAASVHEIHRRVAAPLGVSPAAPGPIRFALQERGAAVLVLDGADAAREHLAPLVAAWLAELPELAIVLTSRAVVDAPGVAAVAVGPLPEPEAVALFCDRARLGAPGFRLEPGRDDLGRLLDRIDRLPLAIELAAARMVGMRVDQILAVLDRGLDLLGGSGMAAMLDGSVALLTAAQRKTLSQLAVFAAPFTLDDAEVVLGSGQVLDRVQALVDRSLVHPVDDRYALYGVVREHVRDHHPPDPEVWRRHAVWFARWGSRERLALVRREIPERARARAATPELLAVVDRMWTDAPELAGRAALALLATYTTFGPFEAARDLVRTLEGLGCSDGLRGELLLPACDIDLFFGGGQTSDLASRALALSLELDTAFALRVYRARGTFKAGQLAAAEMDLDWCRLHLGEIAAPRRGLYHLARGEWLEHVRRIPESQEEYQQGCTAFRLAGDVAGEAAALGMLAVSFKASGDYVGGAAAYRESVERSVGWSERNEGITRMHWAVLERQRGDLEAATTLLAEAERLHLRVGNPLAVEVVRIEQALVLVRRGQYDQARDLLEGCVRRNQGQRPNNATWLYAALALVRFRMGDSAGAQAAIDVALHLAHVGHLWFAEASHQGLLALLDAGRGELDVARSRLAHGSTLLTEVGNRTALARLAAIGAVIEARCGPADVARAAIDHARSLAATFDLRPEADLLEWIHEAEQALDDRGRIRTSGSGST